MRKISRQDRWAMAEMEVKMGQWGEKWSGFLREKPWRKLKKTDWVVLALAGVLILIIAMPMGEKKSNNDLLPAKETAESASKEQKTESTKAKDDYISRLENKLEKVLSQMEGVGKVTVMITVADNGSYVVEKDMTKSTTTTTENDSNGGSRTVTEQQTGESTIYTEEGQEKTPYIQKENLPTIEGIVVVAEGGGNGKTVSDISETIQALFPVEAHRIKVVKMESKEG